MHVQVLRVGELEPDDLVAWSALAARAVEPNPFFEPETLVPAARHLQGGSEFEVAVASEAGRFTALIPLAHSTRRPFPYPFLTTKLRRIHESGAPLLDPELGAEGFAAILEHLARRKTLRRARILFLPALTEEGSSFELLTRAIRLAGMPRVITDVYERGFFYRRAERGLEDHLSLNMRKNLRRTRRRLAEHVGATPTLEDWSTDASAGERFVELEAAGYKGRAGIAVASRPPEKEYFLESYRSFAEKGRARTLALVADDTLLALYIWFSSGPGVFAVKTTYDEAYARFRPGTMLTLAQMEFFSSGTDALWLDSCASRNNQLLLDLYPDRCRTASLLIPLGRNAFDRAAVRAYAVAHPLHGWGYDTLHPRTRVARGSGQRAAGSDR